MRSAKDALVCVVRSLPSVLAIFFQFFSAVTSSYPPSHSTFVRTLYRSSSLWQNVGARGGRPPCGIAASRQVWNSSRADREPRGHPSRTAMALPASHLAWFAALRAESSASAAAPPPGLPNGSCARSSEVWYATGASSISQGHTHMGSSPSGSLSKSTCVFSHGSSPPRTRDTRPSQYSAPLAPFNMPTFGFSFSFSVSSSFVTVASITAVTAVVSGPEIAVSLLPGPVGSVPGDAPALTSPSGAALASEAVASEAGAADAPGFSGAASFGGSGGGGSAP